MLVDVARRAGDRLRPWTAPEPAADARRVLVIGGGPAGLATAALLRRRGVRSIVADRADEMGGSWPTRYESLRLNTVRWMSDLPGHPMPRRLGRWVARDDVVRYLCEYAAHHRLEIRSGVEVERLEQAATGWTAVIDGHAERFDGVVVATGHSAVPTTPDWPGIDGFGGRLIHSSTYRRPADHAGRRVVVVGAGSSGGEIVVDLVRAGVDVTWSVRSAPQVFPRQVMSVPTTPFGPIGDIVPDDVVDWFAPRLERSIYGARDYLPTPTTPMMQLLARCKEPLTADGIVEAIRSGAVDVVAGVRGLTSDGVELDDGTRRHADDVIAATGFRPALGRLVGHLDVLDDGRPRSLVPLPGLGFVGFRIPLTGTLWAIHADSHRVARSVCLEPSVG